MKITREQFEKAFQQMNASWAYENAALSDVEKELLFKRLIGEISDAEYNKMFLSNSNKKGPMPMRSLTDDELNGVLREATQLARDRAKAAGTSIVYELQGKMIREYSDGRKTEIIQDCLGERKEIEYNEHP